MAGYTIRQVQNFSQLNGTMSDSKPLTVRLNGLALREYPGQSYPVDGIIPHRHQWALHNALTESVPGVFVNDAPTGAGKTLSWLAPAISNGLDTVAVYPTNALIEDQKENIQSLLADIEGGDDVRLLAVSSDTLRNEYATEYPAADTNGERLSYLLHESFQNPETVILLTNPDIFVLLRREMYRARTGQINLFDVAVVDEFHRATRKEQNTLLFLLDEMYDADDEICRLSQLVFLSATPDEELAERFAEALAGPYYPLTDFGWRNTKHPAVPQDQQPVISFAPGELPTAYRAVLPPVELELEPAETFQTATHLSEQREVTIDRLSRGRTVLMLDGIHEVDRVYRMLTETDLGVVERIDGFHRGGIATKLKTFDTLVSNAAVEVGVDFETDQVLFSAHSTATFFQRLGRLRTREATSKAYAYIPPYVYKQLQADVDVLDGQWIDRDRFEELISQHYVDDSTPKSFDRRYSAIEAYHHIDLRAKRAPQDDVATVRKEGYERIERHFFRTHDTVFTEDDLRRCAEVAQSELLDKLQMYRGETLQLTVYDPNQEVIQNYNLTYLLRHGNIDLLERERFFKRIPEDLEDEATWAERYSSGYCVYYGSYDNDQETTDEEYSGREISFKPTGRLYSLLSNGVRQTREPEVCSGLEVETSPNIDGLDQLKESLSGKDILCYPIEGHVKEITKQYSIGEFGFVYPLLNPEGDTAAIAFSHDALYLYCRVQDQIESDGLGIEVNDI